MAEVRFLEPPWRSRVSVQGVSQARILQGCHFLLQGIFLDQGPSPCLLYWQTDFVPLSQQSHFLLSFQHGTPLGELLRA